MRVCTGLLLIGFLSMLSLIGGTQVKKRKVYQSITCRVPAHRNCTWLEFNPPKLNKDNCTGEYNYEGQGPNGEPVTVPCGMHWLFLKKDTPTFYDENDQGTLKRSFFADPPETSDTPTEVERVRFHLWTRETPPGNKVLGERLLVDDRAVLVKSTFNSKLPTKILIHGYSHTINSPSIKKPKDAYLESGDCNVIGVDWGEFCQVPFYKVAVKNTAQVGRYVGRMIGFLIKEGGATPDSIHVIGHSLGAHVAGIAGTNAGGSKIGRVTGLDPDIVLREVQPTIEYTLDSTDASFVDVIHTCGGLYPYRGDPQPLGTVDIYPNRGISPQPGCNGTLMEKIICSHAYAYVLWTEIIGPGGAGKYEAQRCSIAPNFELKRCSDPKNNFDEASIHRMAGIYNLLPRVTSDSDNRIN